jgi:stage V sporulation protein R
MGEPVFFSEVAKRYPEFEALFEKHKKRQREATKDLLQYLQQYSPFLQKEENKWMKPVLQIVRNTSLFFQPQIRTKILNEGWASYWHEKLFLQDDRINGNEVGFARVNAKVTALPRVGINPYALGMKLFEYVEHLGDHGKFSHEFQRIQDIETRKHYDLMTGKGMEDVFRIRENFSDFMFINAFVDQDFVDRNRLFVAGKRLNSQKGVWEYYVKSRNADAYKQTLLDSLYHPPFIEVDQTKSENNILYLNHRFEGKPLVKEFIHNTMLGLEYLWGNPVKLETTEVISDNDETNNQSNYFSTVYSEPKQSTEKELKYQRVLYTMKDRTLSKGLL